MIKLTNRQLDVLQVIYQHITSTGISPSVREIAEYLNIASTNGVMDHLRSLENKGYINRLALKSRAIRLTPRALERLGADPNVDGALILRGRTTLEGDPHGCQTLVIKITPQANALLNRLTDIGLFGTSPSDVAERLLYEKLREVLLSRAANAPSPHPVPKAFVQQAPKHDDTQEPNEEDAT